MSPGATEIDRPAPRLRYLRRAELPVDTVALARFLIGSWLLRDDADGRRGGIIVETEAYPPGDAASHAWRRRTPRNGAMYGRRGHAYAYLCYGTAVLVNVTSEATGTGAAVLLRALEPRIGIAAMQARRGHVPLRDLARGPGRLTQALGITLADDGVDLCAPGALRLAREAAAREPVIATSVRIGITRDASRPLRFFVAGSRFASGTAALNASR